MARDIYETAPPPLPGGDRMEGDLLVLGLVLTDALKASGMRASLNRSQGVIQIRRRWRRPPCRVVLRSSGVGLLVDREKDWDDFKYSEEHRMSWSDIHPAAFVKRCKRFSPIPLLQKRSPNERARHAWLYGGYLGEYPDGQ